MMKRSVYLRVPSDIADLIELDQDANVTLHLVDQGTQVSLIYTISGSNAGARLRPSRSRRQISGQVEAENRHAEELTQQ